MNATQIKHTEKEIDLLQKRLNVLKKLIQKAKIQKIEKELKKELGQIKTFQRVSFKTNDFGSLPSSSVIEAYVISKKKVRSTGHYLIYVPDSTFYIETDNTGSIDKGVGCFLVCKKNNNLFIEINGFSWANVYDNDHIDFVKKFSETTNKLTDNYINLVCKKLDLEGKQRAKKQLADFKKSKK